MATPKITKVHRERFMSEWPAKYLRSGPFALLGGRWFSFSEGRRTVQLANFETVDADRVLVGNEELAWAWDWSKRSVEDWLRSTRAQSWWSKRLPRELAVGSGCASEAKNAQVVMPADYSMIIYQEHVLEYKARYQVLQGKARIDWSRRIPFQAEFEEKLFVEHERDTEQARRDYERYETGNYAEADEEKRRAAPG